MREATPGQPISVVITMTLVHCATCGSPFGMPEDLNRRRREDGEKFFCPAGHINYYKGGVDALKKEVDALKKVEADLRGKLAAAVGALDDEKRAHLKTHEKYKRAAPPPPPVEVPKVDGTPAPPLAHRILAHLADKPDGARYKEIATALGANVGTVSATCSSLFRQKRLERPEPGAYKLPQAA